jgi:cation:H+ antiporter
VVASIATGRGEHGLALGTVLGSNIANIGLVLGATGLILPRVFAQVLSMRETSWLLGSLGLLYLVSGGGALGWVEGLVLFLGFVLYQVLVLRNPREEGASALEEVATHGSRHPWVLIVLGSIAIALGAYGAMEGGIGLAEALGVPPTVIGFTVLAVGTSLPELAAGIVSALKGHAELGLGNVVGSNIFNTLMVLGIAFGTGPLDPDSSGILERTMEVDLPLTAAFSLGLIVFLRLPSGRWKAVLALVAYFAWSASMFAGLGG